MLSQNRKIRRLSLELMSEEHGLNLEVIQKGEWLNHILVHAADAAFNKMNVHHMFFSAEWIRGNGDEVAVTSKDSCQRVTDCIPTPLDRYVVS